MILNYIPQYHAGFRMLAFIYLRMKFGEHVLLEKKEVEH